jgi:hypothetical protein
MDFEKVVTAPSTAPMLKTPVPAADLLIVQPILKKLRDVEAKVLFTSTPEKLLDVSQDVARLEADFSRLHVVPADEDGLQKLKLVGQLRRAREFVTRCKLVRQSLCKLLCRFYIFLILKFIKA